MSNKSYASVRSIARGVIFDLPEGTDLAGAIREILDEEVANTPGAEYHWWRRQDDKIPPGAEVRLFPTASGTTLELRWTDADERRYAEVWDAAQAELKTQEEAELAAAEAEKDRVQASGRELGAFIAGRLASGALDDENLPRPEGSDTGSEA